MKFATCLLAMSIAISSSMAVAQEHAVLDDSPSMGAIVIDLAILRPLGLVATVAGSGLFVLSLPFSIMRGTEPIEPAQQLVLQPARFTFTRPVGRSD